MKKFALLGAVAALATAGGVFAAWTFSSDTTIANDTTSISVDFDDEVDYDGAGSIEITACNLTFNLVGNGEEDANTYTASISGSLTVTYTPDTTVGVEDKGATVKVTAPAINIVSGDQSVSADKLEKSGDVSASTPTFTFTYDATFTYGATVDTYGEYTSFKAAVESYFTTYTITASAVALA